MNVLVLEADDIKGRHTQVTTSKQVVWWNIYLESFYDLAH